MPVNISIDGPSGAGKSSAAKALAEKLGYLYMDTGALYRAVGLYCLQAKVADLKDENQVAGLLKNVEIEMKYDSVAQRIYLNGADVSEQIRQGNVSMAASAVSALPKVREFLLDFQRSCAKENNVIMDGRDIGTVVLPLADVKFFLTAKASDRAERRAKELEAKGMKVDFDRLYKDMLERDSNDASRDIAPLKAADDAILLDNSNMTLEETVEFMQSVIKERVG